MTIMDKEEYSSNKTKKKKKQTTTIKKDVPKKKKQSLLKYRFISFFMIIFTVIMLGIVIYNNIFSISNIILLVLITAFIMFIISFLLTKTKLRRWIKNFISLIAVLIIIIDILMIFFGTSTLKFLASITDTGYRVETYGVYTIDNSEFLTDLDGEKINYLSTVDNDNVLKAIDKINKEITIDYEGIEGIDKLLDELFANNVRAIIFEVSYEEILKEEYEEEYKQLNRITTIDIIDTVNTIQSDVDLSEEPFIVYISGIDTTGNIASKARSDVNILMAVHPKTKNILMINTPRDYYVTLHTLQAGDKLTHAGIYGIEESVYTLEDLYDIDIDYYIRANFTSILKMIDALGGIEVDVPISFCEQDSNRSFKENDLICLKKGLQTLDGEEALALARHRKTLPTGDRARGQNQMLVLEAMIEKALSPKIITNYSSLIDALEGRVVTNITTDEMYLGAKMVAKDPSGWDFLSLSAKGSDGSKPCYSVGNGYSSVLLSDEGSINSIKEAIDDLQNGEETIHFDERKSEAASY